MILSAILDLIIIIGIEIWDKFPSNKAHPLTTGLAYLSIFSLVSGVIIFFLSVSMLALGLFLLGIILPFVALIIHCGFIDPNAKGLILGVVGLILIALFLGGIFVESIST